MMFCTNHYTDSGMITTRTTQLRYRLSHVAHKLVLGALGLGDPNPKLLGNQ